MITGHIFFSITIIIITRCPVAKATGSLDANLYFSTFLGFFTLAILLQSKFSKTLSLKKITQGLEIVL